MIRPSWEKIEKCKKADLLIVANCYDVQVLCYDLGCMAAWDVCSLCAGGVVAGLAPGSPPHLQ